MSKNFAANPTINITRSRFNINHKVLTTFNAGQLIPFDVTEILPGDTFKNKTSVVMRMTTPIKPVMDNAWADIMYFFVPNRIIWDHWEEFQGANKTGPWTQKTEYTIPQTVAPEKGWNTGTIADYMGIPTKVPGKTETNQNGLSVNSLPLRAYVQIWNDWWRDENLQNYSYLNTDDSTTQGTNNNNYITSPITGGQPLPVNKMHDYFTSALPEPQKGPDVLLPLGQKADVFTDSTLNSNITSNPLKMVDSSGNLYNNTKAIGINNYNGGIYTWGSSSTIGTFNDAAIPGNLQADLSSATAATINQIRQAFQLQKMFEKDARGGTRYVEILKNHFGVTASDARLQRAEYLGGKKIPITMSQVVQTSSTDTTSPQGNTSAFSLTIDSSDYFTKSFEEHGYIIGVLCVRTEKTYQQGLNKLWSRLERTDFYMPVFANLGEQPIYNKEIFTQGNEKDNEVFGYQEAWADYRYKPNRVSGEFRSNSTDSQGNSNTQDYYHYADDYETLPTLGSDFITEKAANIDRTITVQSSQANQFLADIYIEEIATRPMPVYSIPGLIDHH